MIAPHAVMLNILGRITPRYGLNNIVGALKHDKAHLHLYGKKISREGRKMGHITLLGDSLKPLLRMANHLESQLSL